MSITEDQYSRLLDSVAAKSSEACLAIFADLLSNDKTYFFGRCYRNGELRQLLTHAGVGELLEILMFGHHSDLRRLRQDNTLSLISADTTEEKIKVLTFVKESAEAVANGVSRITYDAVASATGMKEGDVRGVEDLVLSAMSADLVDCRLNQRERFVEIISSQPREVLMPNDTLSFVKCARGPCKDIIYMLDRLQVWRLNTQDAAVGISYIAGAIQERQHDQERNRQARDRLSAEVLREELTLEKIRRLKAARE